MNHTFLWRARELKQKRRKFNFISRETILQFPTHYDSCLILPLPSQHIFLSLGLFEESRFVLLKFRRWNVAYFKTNVGKISANDHRQFMKSVLVLKTIKYALFYQIWWIVWRKKENKLGRTPRRSGWSIWIRSKAGRTKK